MNEKTIKAITLYQPWASLVAIGAKKIETRSWSTNYRGELAIHAGMNDSKMNIIGIVPEIWKALSHSSTEIVHIPFGTVIAICKLVDCVQIQSEKLTYVWLANDEANELTIKIPPPSPELEFGDYTPGRWAWILDDVRLLPTPIPATGHQRLWDFTFDEEVMK